MDFDHRSRRVSVALTRTRWPIRTSRRSRPKRFRDRVVLADGVIEVTEGSMADENDAVALVLRDRRQKPWSSTDTLQGGLPRESPSSSRGRQMSTAWVQERGGR
jgi:hypothetical protein